MTGPALTTGEIRERLSRPWKHGEHADLRGIVCAETLDLRGLSLAGADFSGARLAGIDATGAVFQGLSWFRGVRFGGKAAFGGARFSIDARFEEANFGESADFAGAEFRGIGRFDRAQFAAGADFSDTVAYGNVSLHGIVAHGAASFRGGEWLGGLWLQDARLPEQTDLSGTLVHGRLWLRGARRGGLPLRAEDFGMSFGYTYN